MHINVVLACILLLLLYARNIELDFKAMHINVLTCILSPDALGVFVMGIYCVLYLLHTFFSFSFTHGDQGLKGLNHERCGTRNIFRFSDDILHQGGRPTFISIGRYKAYIFGTMCL